MNIAQAVHEGVLLSQLKYIFTESETHVKSRKGSSIIDPSTGAYLELDAWLPDYDLCFEFQDAYHYVPIWYKQIKQEKIERTDELKKNLALLSGITLVNIPCWWDGTTDRLIASINFERPELFTSDLQPISLNPPNSFFMEAMPETICLMLASFPSNPDFSSSIYAHTWWIGEKYDGVRLFWNALRNTVFSRTGKTLHLLPQVIQHLPSTTCVDGEFWFGRGQFSHACLLFIGSTKLVNWVYLRSLVFDVPSNNFHAKSFEARYALLFSIILLSNPVVIVVPRALCENEQHLKSMTHNILGDGGEGLILQKFGSRYTPGRTQELLKLKRYYGDLEAVVVGIGKGGSPISVKLPTGRIFEVPARNVHVHLKLGDVITFSYENQIRRDVPVNPQIYKVRTDLAWQDVMTNAYFEPTYLNAKSFVKGFTPSPTSSWTKRTTRLYLEREAQASGKDPLLLDTWYSLYDNIHKLSPFLMRKFKGGYFQMLTTVFPEINLDFDNQGRLLQRDIGYGRKLLENYARKHKFNALNPKSWYSQSISQILAFRGMGEIVRRYGNNITQTIQYLFPDIGFTTDDRAWSESDSQRILEQFASSRGFNVHSAEDWHYQSRSSLMDHVGIHILVRQYGSLANTLRKILPNIEIDQLMSHLTYYNKKANRRSLFERHAIKQGLDPHKAHDWYHVNMCLPDLKAVKGIGAVLCHHGNSLVQALIELFPHLKLEKTKLRANYHAGKRRHLFERFAHRAGFDAFNAENWYTQSRDAILAAEGVSRAIFYHQNSVPRALVELFPSIGLEELKFHVPMWRNPKWRRQFFEDYALKHMMNPNDPDAWYTTRFPSSCLKQAAELLLYHNNSIHDALVDLFPELKLDKTLFERYWDAPSNRRKFFAKYADEHGFDPLDPLGWNSHSISSIMSRKGASKVMEYHRSVGKALCDLFPEAGFNIRKIQMKYKHRYHSN